MNCLLWLNRQRFSVICLKSVRKTKKRKLKFPKPKITCSKWLRSQKQPQLQFSNFQFPRAISQYLDKKRWAIDLTWIIKSKRWVGTQTATGTSVSKCQPIKKWAGLYRKIKRFRTMKVPLHWIRVLWLQKDRFSPLLSQKANLFWTTPIFIFRTQERASFQSTCEGLSNQRRSSNNILAFKVKVCCLKSTKSEAIIGKLIPRLNYWGFGVLGFWGFGFRV